VFRVNLVTQVLLVLQVSLTLSFYDPRLSIFHHSKEEIREVYLTSFLSFFFASFPETSNLLTLQDLQDQLVFQDLMDV
jgi:hypothetical protein